MKRCLVVCTALKSDGKTHTLARAMGQALAALDVEVDLMDLATEPLPACDGANCYADPAVKAATERVKRAAMVVICSPIYNYQVNAAAKNFVELTNAGWPDKIVGIAVCAGGDRSYLAVLSLANSLWLDHHCLLAPRFVYATGAAFTENGALRVESDVGARLHSLAADLRRLAVALAPAELSA
jgi:NAD(P)H-dependent FMN reductase